MKTLIINGSPRKNGDTMALIKELTNELEGEIYRFDVYCEDIKACIDCRYCWQNEGCIINDKMQDIYSLLDEVDNFIIASPLYFSELTGELLSFASRFQTYYAQQNIRMNLNYRLKEKLGALIIVGGGDGSSKPAEDRAETFFNLTNTKFVKTIRSLNTNTLPAIEDEVAHSDIAELGRLLMENFY